MASTRRLLARGSIAALPIAVPPAAAATSVVVSLAVTAIAAMAAGSAIACGAKRDPRDPEVAAAGSAPAQSELRRLETEWQVSSPRERRAMRPRLEEFVGKQGTDSSVARARLLLARALLLDDQLAAAEAVLAPVLALRVGRSVDEARIVHAAIVSRQGRPEVALELLEPLDGKLVTADARYEYALERTRAALAARRWRLAIDTMAAWVTTAEGQVDEVRAWVVRALPQIPDEALARVLTDWKAEGQSTGAAFTQRAIIDHLVARALEREDPELARHLLTHSPAWLRSSDAGDDLALLASRAEEEAHVSGRLVGVVVGGPDARTRRRSAALARGLMDGLNRAAAQRTGAARAMNGGSPLGLLAEDAGSSVKAALAALRGQGALILVAATEPIAALEALSFAESRRVPVVVLTPSLELSADRLGFGFDFGISERQQQEFLSERLAERDLSPVAFVGLADLPCPELTSRPGQSVLPLGEWTRSGVRSVAVLGDAHCADRVLAEVRLLESPPLVALGLEAAAGPLTPALGARRPRLAYLSSARFPSSAPAVLRDDAAEPGSNAVATDWFETLGRDLAGLLDSALSTLPAAHTSDLQEVKRLHERARDALLTATAELSTAQVSGFGGTHRLPRELALSEAP